VLVDGVVAGGSGIDLHRDGLVVGQVEGRANVNLGGEGHVLAVLDLGDIHLGPTDRHDLLLAQGGLVGLRDGVVDHLFEDYSPAETLLDHPGWNLALAKARNVDLLADGLVRLVETGLQFLERQLHRQLHARRTQGLDVGLHVLLQGGR